MIPETEIEAAAICTSVADMPRHETPTVILAFRQGAHWAIEKLSPIITAFNTIRKIEREGAWVREDDKCMIELGRFMLDWFREYDKTNTK